MPYSFMIVVICAVLAVMVSAIIVALGFNGGCFTLNTGMRDGRVRQSRTIPRTILFGFIGSSHVITWAQIPFFMPQAFHGSRSQYFALTSWTTI